MLTRFSSRLVRLDHAFLRDRLRDARSYDRIAGYFRSSIFEVASEELVSVGRVRVVCNSDLSSEDLRASQEARSQAMLQRWWDGGPGATPLGLETLLHRDRFADLKALLLARGADGKPKVEVRVIDRVTAPLVHGKAGIITLADGRRTCFIGSVNETREAWQKHYELLWEDDSEEAVTWTQSEFDFLWSKSLPMPDAIIREIDRCADRVEIRIQDCPPWSLGGETDLPRAAMSEAPIVRNGEGLQPWQKAFVAEFLRHREVYGKGRILLADEVGVGKTLSLATAALVQSLLGDGPALILTPSTLCEQWQVELWDHLGVPSARWVSARKVWIDHLGHVIRTTGTADVVRCPYRVAIVSTGLIMRGSEEVDVLLSKRARPGESPYGMVVLDEAHRARGQRAGSQEREPNNLLTFMQHIGHKTRHLLLATATPIQTDPLDLWDLIGILGGNADHVLGDQFSLWRNRPQVALALVRGDERPRTDRDAWPWLANPLPPAAENEPVFDLIRQDLKVPRDVFGTSRSHTDLDLSFTRPELEVRLRHDDGDLGFFQRNNPVVRHTVLRRRKALEEARLMKPVAVAVNPVENEPDRRTRAFFGETGRAVATTSLLTHAFDAAEEYAAALMARNRGAGLIKSLLLQRICSSSVAGLATVTKIACHYGLVPDEDGPDQSAPEQMTDDDDDEAFDLGKLGAPAAGEMAALKRLLAALREAVSRTGQEADPKFRVVVHYLAERRWLQNWGCIVFSQYYDTARWVAERLAAYLHHVPVALYAGAGKSGVFRDDRFTSAPRDAIKAAVREREIRLVVATDAASEGLNLQTLGTLINVDLPWNPSRLEQRLGRIKRFGQVRDTVDMLNLVYEGSRDEAIYEKLSDRMKDRFDVLGQLPDTLDDDWIDSVERLDEELRKFADRRRRANAFDLRWGGTATGIALSGEQADWQRGWENCAKVLAREDILKAMREGW